jgi:SpoVK/Ycf46/Vps4 family AAA+-type ATPase
MSDSINAFSLVIVQKATGHIDTCVQHLTDGAHDKAKQSSLQAKVLLDLLDSMENHPILKLCSKSLSSVVSAASGRNQDPSEATASSTTEEYSTNPSLDVAAASPEIRFADIVGHGAAKDALYENVVLPMLMPEHLKRKVYCGIRANPGNVLLFGLPGTGKTILARALRFLLLLPAL